MPLWGSTVNAESRPLWLSAAEKKKVRATNRGWERTDTGEILVAIRGLAEAKLAAASIVNVDLATRAANTTNVEVTVTWNEDVTVSTANGTPSILLTATTGSLTGNGHCFYVSQPQTNQALFRYIPVSGDNANVVGANVIGLNTGTINDTANDSVNALLDMEAGGADNATDLSNGVFTGEYVIVA